MVMGEVDIGLMQSSLSRNPGDLGRLLGFMSMVMREVDRGLRPVTFLHITMVDYTFSIQG